MNSVKLFFPALLGCALGLIAWVLFNIFPIVSIFDFGFFVTVLLLVRQRVSTAIAFGMGYSFVVDVGSYHVFPLHAVSLLLMCAVVVQLIHRVTHRSYLGYVSAGFVSYLTHQFFLFIFSGLFDGGFFAAVSRFSFFWMDFIVFMVTYVGVISLLYRRWKVIHVTWARAS